jgi:2-methylcitrate dehydratase PrpD
MSSRPSSESLAELAILSSEQGVPDEVREKAGSHLLDLLGVCLAASRADFAPAVRAVAGGLGGPPEAFAIGLQERLAAPNAALLNGTLAHGLDYDDTHLASVVHPSATVAPAALAVAEEIDASGEKLLSAYAVGIEAAVRIGLAGSGAFHERGFHATPICGVIGATLAAGALYGLSQERLVCALGLAASMSGGLLEFLGDGTSAKRMHGGWAAHGGVIAARLGRAGFTGPRGGIDGRFGLLHAMLGDAADATRVGADLGRRWEMLDIALKPYPCCHFVHAFLDLADRLRVELGAPRGAPAPRELVEKVVRIECALAPLAIPVVGEPAETKRRPQTPYDAQFSLPFGVAAMVARGRVTLAEFSAESIADPALLRLAARVDVRPDPRDDFPRRFPGRLRLELADGRSLEASQDDNRGGPADPLSREEILAKFRDNALPSLGDAGVNEVATWFAARPLVGARALTKALGKARSS